MISQIKYLSPRYPSPEIEQIMYSLGNNFRSGLAVLEAVVRQMPKPNEIILDVGTGRGKMAIFLALHGYFVHTGEPEGNSWADWEMFAKFAGVHSRIKFKPFRPDKLPFKDNLYPGSVTHFSMHHFSDPIRFFSEMIRVTCKGGLIAVIELTPLGILELKEKEPDHPDALDWTIFDSHQDSGAELLFIVKDDIFDAHIYRKYL